jgi:hypothetical protein
MSAPETILTTQGSLEDVAAFFLKSTRTISDWAATKKNGRTVTPILACWRMERDPVFGEEDVVRLRAKFYIADEGLAPGEAEARARREWRALLKLRRDDALGRQLEKVKDLLDATNARLTRLESRQTDFAVS